MSQKKSKTKAAKNHAASRSSQHSSTSDRANAEKEAKGVNARSIDPSSLSPQSSIGSAAQRGGANPSQDASEQRRARTKASSRKDQIRGVDDLSNDSPPDANKRGDDGKPVAD